jgi:hypothetical protein
MRSPVKAAGLAGAVVAVFAALAADLDAAQLNTGVREGQAVVSKLSGNASAVTYWVSRSDGWRVVTTVDTVIKQGNDLERHGVVRFSAVLLPGQSQDISVPFAVGERQPVLRIRRLGDRLDVTQVPGST